ncbi:MAG: glycosyltransferase family 4 protein [Bacteroides sp.]|nr:glycosyltransferase family 4 protein [Bacteroides sp.]
MHDLIFIKPEAKFPQEKVQEKLRLYEEIASKCKYIVTVSEYSKKDIVEQLNVPPERVIVIPNGWQHMTKIGLDDSVFGRYDLLKKGKYYYAMGNIMPHKNFKWIVETAKRNPDCTFAIAGNMHELSNKAELKLDNVLYLGRVTDEENKSLIKYCKAFIHPAFLEGFGIPPMEALTFGRPIIVSNTSCMPEIYGGAAHYVDPYRYDYGLDTLLLEHVENPETVLNKYSWEQSGRHWYELFQSLQEV